MTYEVDHNLGLIYVTESRSPSLETLRQHCVALPKLAQQVSVSKILFDVRGVTKQPSTLERFEFSVEIAKHFRGIKLAFLTNEQLYDPERFGENVAINRGADICAFTDLEQAYDWLGVNSRKNTKGEA